MSKKKIVEQTNLFRDWGLKGLAKIIAECEQPTRTDHCKKTCEAYYICDKPIWKTGQLQL